MTRYFVYTSGENNNVAQAEVNALTRLLELKITSWKGRIGLVDSSVNPIPFLIDRAAMVKEAGVVLVKSADPDTIQSDLSDDDSRIDRKLKQDWELISTKSLELVCLLITLRCEYLRSSPRIMS